MRLAPSELGLLLGAPIVMGTALGWLGADPAVAPILTGRPTLSESRFALLWLSMILLSALPAWWGLWRRSASRNDASATLRRLFLGLLWSIPAIAYVAVVTSLRRSSGTPTEFSRLVYSTGDIVLALSLAGWIATVSIGRQRRLDRARGDASIVVIAALLYAATFSTLAILQTRALNVPHGDSAMYEEHLWNVLHEKGFRSQLDDGRSFLGEHVEFVHLLLLPIYVLDPSLDLLHSLKSLALGMGSLGVFWIARRRGLPSDAGRWLALAYLVSFPVQYLDLEANWKSFRPESFGVPLLLAGLGAFEAHHLIGTMVLFALAATAKEDYLFVLAGIGLWISISSLRPNRPPAPTTGDSSTPVDNSIGVMTGEQPTEAYRGGQHARFRLTQSGLTQSGLTLSGLTLFGLTLFTASLAALALAVLVVIPWIRGGAPHYAPYFASLGATPSEIVWTIVTRPGWIVSRWATAENGRFVLLALGSAGFLSLGSPGRLLVAGPVFAYLALGEREGMNTLFFHFHGPILPILWWSAAAGAGNLARWIQPKKSCLFAFVMSLTLTAMHGKGPLSRGFHDRQGASPRDRISGRFEPRGTYWRDLYVPGSRRSSLEKLLTLIDVNERVAATDYLRPAFTHHRAAHDYPTLRHHVTIDDVDVIVLDKTEGWWGRGPSNPDRELLTCLSDSRCRAGSVLLVRGRPFVVIFHDDYLLAVRSLASKSGKTQTR